MKHLFTIAIVLLLPPLAALHAAELRLPSIFSDHLVLQCDKAVPVWGWADAGEQIIVEFAGQTKSATANADDKWTLRLDALDASADSRELVVRSLTRNRSLKVADVLVGEVWAGGGQSNMEFDMKALPSAAAEIEASANPTLRQFHVLKNPSARTPVDDVQGYWTVARPGTTEDFIAAGYYFAKRIQRELNTPVGLIKVCWGGSKVEPWISPASLASVPELASGAKNMDAMSERNKSAFREWLNQTQREDRTSGDVSRFLSGPVSKDDGWVAVKDSGPVSDPSLPKFGAFWFRKEVSLSARQTGAAQVFQFGPSAQFDQVYWNGTLIGERSVDNFTGLISARHYLIPPTLLKEGVNQFAVRLFAPAEPPGFSWFPSVGTTKMLGGWMAKAEYALPPLDAAGKNAVPPLTGQHVLPGRLFNGMVHPLLPYAIRGVLWYQGESNTGNASLYRTSFPLLIPQDAAPHTRAAAVELAAHLESIGGVRPEVIERLPDPLPAQAIWVGYQPALDRLFPGADLTLRHPEEVLLIGNENHIAITGRDRWDPKHSVVEGRRFPITDQQQEYGTANAVFTFLQDQVGVRWFYPGETGTDYPGPEALNIAPFQLRYHPQFRSRIGLFNQLARGYIKENDMQRWAKHQRLLLDSFTFDGGHYFEDWWEKYGETRPELFALQPDGTRGTFPKDPMRRKLCEGEPRLWQTWLDEQEKRLAAYPHHDVLYTMANDSYYEGHCTDPRSRAWDPVPTETDVRVRMSWANGVTEEWPPLSDRYVRFANKLSELAETRFPGRDFLVMMNAYGEAGKPAPVKAVPRDNILVVSVHNFILRHEAMRKEEKQQFADWAKVSKQLFWRPNLGNQGGTQTGFPDVPFQQAMEDMRFAAEHGVMGVFFDSLFEHWSPNASFFYLLSQLTWNPYADGNAILEDYYRRCYGPAAGPMKEYWKLMEHTRQKMVDTIALPRVSVLRSH